MIDGVIKKQTTYDQSPKSRIYIKPCKKQPDTCKSLQCSECCELRENENLFFMAIRKAV